MKKIYIAGPFRAPSAWEREEQIRDAERVGLLVAGLGHVPVIPHTMYRHFDGTVTDLFWLEATLELLKMCDAMLLVGDFKNSSGSMGEMRYCQGHGIPFFETFEDLGGWLEQQEKGPGSGIRY